MKEKIVYIKGEIGKFFTEIIENHREMLADYKKTVVNEFRDKHNI